MTAEPEIASRRGRARDRYLSREEFARLWFHASPLHLRVFLALAISTGARGKHILALTWDRWTSTPAWSATPGRRAPTSARRPSR
jgi:integrase